MEILEATVGEVLGANLFVYCMNNPVMYVDTDGRTFCYFYGYNFSLTNYSFYLRGVRFDYVVAKMLPTGGCYYVFGDPYAYVSTKSKYFDGYRTHYDFWNTLAIIAGVIFYEDGYLSNKAGREAVTWVIINRFVKDQAEKKPDYKNLKDVVCEANQFSTDDDAIKNINVPITNDSEITVWKQCVQLAYYALVGRYSFIPMNGLTRNHVGFNSVDLYNDRIKAGYTYKNPIKIGGNVFFTSYTKP